jgi:hypothetical protein
MRLQFHALAYNPDNSFRTLATPETTIATSLKDLSAGLPIPAAFATTLIVHDHPVVGSATRQARPQVTASATAASPSADTAGQRKRR